MWNIVEKSSLKSMNCIPGSARLTMKNVAQLLNSPEVAKKIESNPAFQMDNPIKAKIAPSTNLTKNIFRKRKTSKITWTEDLVTNLRKTSAEYQKMASKRYQIVFTTYLFYYISYIK